VKLAIAHLVIAAGEATLQKNVKDAVYLNVNVTGAIK